MKSIAILFIALFGAVIAHDVSTSPKPRQPDPSGTAYCGSSSNTPPGPAQANVVAGGALTVRWQKNHAGGTSDIYMITPPVQNPTQAQINANKIGSYNYDAGSASVTIPANKAPGMYTLVWEWSGFWSCSEIQVLYTPPEGAVVSSGTVYTLESGGGTFDASSNTCTCKKGYKEYTTETGVCDCKKSVSAGTGFGLFILVVVLIAAAAIGGLLALRWKRPGYYEAIKMKTWGRFSH